MPTTSNFGWNTPADTDLVKDGAAAIRTLGNNIDASLVDLKGGTTGQVLAKATNTDLDFTWVTQDDANAIQNTIVDAKGDLITATANDTPARLAVGANNTVLTADSSTATGLKWASVAAGYNWTLRQVGQFQDTSGLVTIASNGSTIWVAAGRGGNLYSSANGTSWTSRTSGFGANDINKVIFANGIFVAVGANGTITTSTDGTTWTARTSNMGTNAMRDVYYANGYFVAVGSGGGTTNTGGLTYSTDGLTWTRKSQTIQTGSSYNAVIYNGTNWLVGGDVATNNFIYASDPTGTWTAALSPSGAQVYQFFYDGTRVFNITASATLWKYSTSATWATEQDYRGVGINHNNTWQALNFFHSNNIYSISGGFIFNFSTTPVNTNWPSSRSAVQLHPLTNSSTTSPQNENQARTLWVGSQGIIIAGADGQIWTSF